MCWGKLLNLLFINKEMAEKCFVGWKAKTGKGDATRTEFSCRCKCKIIASYKKDIRTHILEDVESYVDRTERIHTKFYVLGVTQWHSNKLVFYSALPVFLNPTTSCSQLYLRFKTGTRVSGKWNRIFKWILIFHKAGFGAGIVVLDPLSWLSFRLPAHASAVLAIKRTHRAPETAFGVPGDTIPLQNAQGTNERYEF